MIARDSRLLLLRHGNTFNAGEVATQIGCKTDLPLTAKGEAQANAFALYLEKHSLMPAAIYSGSLQRQVKTAQIIHAFFPKAALLTHQDALDEIDYGTWEGLPAETIAQQWPQEYRDWCEKADWPAHIFNRQKADHLSMLTQWLEKLKAHTPDKAPVIAVSSNGLMRLMLHFMPELYDSLVNARKMDTYKVSTGHFCDLTFNNGVPSIQKWNCAP